MDKIVKSFFDLEVWQEGRKLTGFVYEKTKKFPREEIFGLVSQMRRSSVSIIANIAEGFGRTSIREKLQFYNQAHGSLTELQSHGYISSDLGYVSMEDLNKFLALSGKVQAILQGLIRSTRKRLP